MKSSKECVIQLHATYHYNLLLKNYVKMQIDMFKIIKDDRCKKNFSSTKVSLDQDVANT